MTALVVHLASISRDDVPRAGGKGANLGELMRGGFRVPDGFVLTTAAYDRFMSTRTMPPEVERELRVAYARLGGGPVAVRSSATAEDLPDAAFAGQQETFLNVIGEAALLRAVQDCWASLWSERAVAYRERVGFAHVDAKLAVVIQRLVPAETAGVMFTANPVSGARDEVIVDASPGLGEAVVGGLVTPDHYVLRRRRWGWKIAEFQLGRREVEVRPLREGGTEHVTPDGAAASQAVLSRRAVRKLARSGARIERHFGAPQDIEWAIANGKLWILQTRPMTALPAAPGRPLPPLISSMAAELFAVRPYPLDLTAWAPAIFGAVTPLFQIFGVRDVPLRRLFIEEDGVAVGLTGALPMQPGPAVLLTPLRFARLSRAYDPKHWKDDPDLRSALAQAQVLDRTTIEPMGWTELLATLREALAMPSALAGEVRKRYFPRAALAVLGLRVLLSLIGGGARFGTLVSGAETQTTRGNRKLEALAAQVRADPGLATLFREHDAEGLEQALEAEPAARAWLAEFRAFLDEFGHREAAIATASLPAWRDAPSIPLGIVKGLAVREPRPSPSVAPWQVERDAILASGWRHLPFFKRVFGSLQRDAQLLLQIREDTHFYATMPLPLVRRIVLELGQRLALVQALDSPSDVFHLRLDELEQIDAWPPGEAVVRRLHSAAEWRKARRAALDGTPLVEPPPVARGAHVTDDVEGVLARGAPGSPGIAEGPVRVVHGGSEFGKLQPGDVLVAPYTNPGWTPLFQRAAAVVADTGGLASHAAIVAREYGIPAVMATGDGTRRLVDGQRVRVDGGRGLVMRLTE